MTDAAMQEPSSSDRALARFDTAWSGMSDVWQWRTLLLAVFVAALIPYLNSLSNGFAFDDAFIIQNNARVHNIRAWRDIWLTPYWPSLGAELGLYRPLSIFLYAVQWAAGDSARWVFHLSNVLLHALVSTLLFVLLTRFAARVPALIGALVFAVHPVHTEAVANVVGQAELTAAALVLVACIIHAKRPEGTAVSWGRRVTITVLYAVALLAKESAVVLPGLLVLIDCMQRRIRLDAKGWRTYVSDMALPILLLVITLAAYLALRYAALGGTITGLDAGPAFPYLKEHRLLNAFRAFPEYLRLLFFPADLTVDYAPATVFAVESWTLMAVVGCALLIGLVVLAATTPWNPLIGAAPAWFIIAISPVSNIFFPIGVLIAERTLYLPSVGLSILVTFLAAHVAATATQQGRRVAALVLTGVLLAAGLRTWVRNPDWKNTDAVQAALFRDHPESYHAQWARALVHWDNAQFREADIWFRLAYRTYPRDSGMMSTYAAFLTAMGRDSAALPLVEKSYEMHPFMLNATALLSFLYITNGQPDRAFDVIRHGERTGFPSAVSLPLRAYAHQGLGQIDEAAAAWQVLANRLRPENGRWLAYAFLARTRAYAGQDSAARAAISQGVAAAPDTASAAMVQRVGAAIDRGCFDDPANARLLTDLYGPPADPTCAPLNGWFDHAAHMQRASFSQFAIPLRIVKTEPPVPK